VQHTPSWLVNLARTTDLHPPVYYLFLHTMGQVTGFGVTILRSWSVLWYALFLGLIYRRIISGLAVNLWGKAGLLGVVAFAPFGIFYASELRSYAAIILVSALQFFAFTDLSKVGSGSGRAVAWRYGIYSFLSLWLFYPCAFTLVAQFLYISIRRRSMWWRFFWPWLVITILYSPWLFSVVLERAGTRPGHFLELPWWQIPAIIAAGFAGGRVAVTDLNHLHQYWPTGLALLGLMVSFSGLWQWWRSDRRNVLVEQLWWCLVVPIIICLVISATRFSVFDPRYYTQIYSLYSVLLVTALGYAWQKSKQWGKGVVAVLQFSRAHEHTRD
jgi:uncharacterized membrane protein